MNGSKRKHHNSNDAGNASGAGGPLRRRRQPPSSGGGNHHNNNHRFGRVMSQPPKLKPNPQPSSSGGSSASSWCHPTVSMAIPGSVVSNAQTRELQTQLAGQIARAAAVFRVDEIVVFDDGLGSRLNTFSNYRRGPSQPRDHHRRREGDGEGGGQKSSPTRQGDDDDASKSNNYERAEKPAHMQPSTDPHAFLARILQYCECPQYLRRKFFPMHPDLQFSGLLPPLDAPHHLRRGDVASFREGVVVEKKGTNGGEDEGGSYVDCGVPNRLVQIDRVLAPGIRCTVQLDPKAYETKRKSLSNKGSIMEGKVVSPTTPRDKDGIYWGYTTRMASSINAIFEECPYDGGYDLKVGTSERGDISIDDPKFCLMKKEMRKAKKSKSDNNDNDGEEHHFDHLLIVFGGVAGIEESVDADESMVLSGEDSKKMFDVWVNVCPYQGSRTIRSEEAVFITLARLSPFIARNVLKTGKKKKHVAKTEDVEFSDEAISEESSDEE
mmetsp:Transcript_13103/g.31873  ORF Transcript_13103/g.31873 Transcript_13103/m.31873 type:complete len:494 (+) Transcript_13103:114-1595(+)